jgi:hypothetical protein
VSVQITGSPLPPAITEAYEAMETLEKFRDPCVRYDHPINQDVTDTCSLAYSKCVAAALQIVDPSRTIES